MIKMFKHLQFMIAFKGFYKTQIECMQNDPKL